MRYLSPRRKERRMGMGSLWTRSSYGLIPRPCPVHRIICPSFSAHQCWLAGDWPACATGTQRRLLFHWRGILQWLAFWNQTPQVTVCTGPSGCSSYRANHFWKMIRECCLGDTREENHRSIYPVGRKHFPPGIPQNKTKTRQMVLLLDCAANPVQFQCWLTNETNIRKKKTPNDGKWMECRIRVMLIL